MLDAYFKLLIDDLNRKSEAIREYYSVHRLSSGENREDLVSGLLRGLLPSEKQISNGLVLSKSGQFSNQADILITDAARNSALFADYPAPIWLVESVYAICEVKTALDKSTLEDSFSKIRKFKNLPRDWGEHFGQQKNPDSLGIIWVFDCGTPENVRALIDAEMAKLDMSQRPDFIVCPGKFLCTSGSYRELSKLGMPGSSHRAALEQQYGTDLSTPLDGEYEILWLGENSLFVFVVWLRSWLLGAGARVADLLKYMPADKNWGHRI